MVASRQREAVHEALARLDHPTADEVFRYARGAMPRISLATVYRNLDAMVHDGEAGMRTIGGQRRYDGNVDDHVHLHCTQCDRLADAPVDPEVGRRLAAKAGAADYDYQDALVEIRGVCPDCKARIQEETT